ncbi:hypothetical protein [Spirosoma aerolatum]|uniref:hypothetical protein n=1 Tax=Spirosoma aerolatum TaxID=1211326 RepID=UPI0009AC4B9C|nr:hypothetical protein [Spirosoma aerolatum]
MNQPPLQRYPHPDDAAPSDQYDTKNNESLAQTRKGQSPVSSSPGETPYEGSHADNYDPDQAPDRSVTEDGPSGENTKNNGAHGGGLWTSGGQVTTGTPYHEGDDDLIQNEPKSTEGQ